MKKLRLLFYSPGKEDMFSSAVSFWGHLWNPKLKRLPAISHCELQFPDRIGDVCFSSATYRKGKKRVTGVRFANTSEVLKNSKRWYYIEFSVNDDVEKSMYEEARLYLGKGFDCIGLFGFCLPWRVQDEGSWYCSEIVNYICWRGGIVDKFRRWSPLASAQMYIDAGYGPLKKLETS